jgi:annexin A7/11
MSYGGPPQGNPNLYGGPPGGQQLGYGPPSGQFSQGPYPPHQHGGFPPQGGYGGPPHGQYPLQQSGFGGPPPPPPPGQFAPYHQAGFGAPQGQFPPPQGGFGGPPPPVQGYGAPPMALPSPGYDPHAAAAGDASRDADALRGAMKGFATDEGVLIRVLSKPDPLQMALLRNTYSTRIQRNLEHDVASETSSHFKDGLVALVRGPLMQDVSRFLVAFPQHLTQALSTPPLMQTLLTPRTLGP